jgi:hypothetical protein
MYFEVSADNDEDVSGAVGGKSDESRHIETIIKKLDLLISRNTMSGVS